MLTQGLQDYLELIYNKIINKEEIKAVDIAREFEISRSSVSEALIRLADKDLIIYEGKRGIQITRKGKIEAKKVIKKHKILSEFFHEILHINKKTADENACKIEHVINDEIISQIKKFTCFCIDKNINKQFQESINND